MRKRTHKNAISLFLFHLLLAFCVSNISKLITLRKHKESKKERNSFDVRQQLPKYIKVSSIFFLDPGPIECKILLFNL